MIMTKKMEEWNSYILWQQGTGYYDNLYVRLSPTENAICVCSTPEIAKWITERLKLAAKLENELNKINHTTHIVTSEEEVLVNGDGTSRIRIKDKLHHI
jgi:hypothetical protein